MLKETSSSFRYNTDFLLMGFFPVQKFVAMVLQTLVFWTRELLSTGCKGI